MSNFKSVSIEQWITALESGEYEKCKYFLKKKTNTSYSYCCLGVLCELAEVDLDKGLTLINGDSMVEAELYLRTSALGRYKETAPLAASLYLNPYLVVKLSMINDTSDTFRPVVEYIKATLL